MTRVMSHTDRDVVDALEKYCEILQSAINKAYEEIPHLADKVTVTWGTKFYKVVKEGQYQKSVHAFIDRKTGQLYKPAGWAAPSKTTNYNIVDDIAQLEVDVEPYGGYLYKRNPLVRK